MQQEFSKESQRNSITNSLDLSNTSFQHGLHNLDHDASRRCFKCEEGDGDGHVDCGSSPPPEQLASDNRSPNSKGIDASQLSDSLRRLSIGNSPEQVQQRPHPGQRISKYEAALTPATPDQVLGFKVTKHVGSTAGSFQLISLSNEILTHILSHLHPDSHASVSLVCKRFHTLVTSPHAWRMAFQRYFPGQDAQKAGGRPAQDDPNVIRSEVRQFTRLTGHASWRSEYLFRIRLLRSLARGKPSSGPGGLGSSVRKSLSASKGGAVLTYNTMLPSPVTHVHGTFTSSRKKPARLVHGCADLCKFGSSDPTSGHLNKWGLQAPFVFAQQDAGGILPQPTQGVGEDPVIVANVMDVSQLFGVVCGEGSPGGRTFFVPSNEYQGRYLDQQSSIVDARSDIPGIPQFSEAISSVWIAKSSGVLMATQSMVGIMAGSTLGVVTTYALDYDPAGFHYHNGEISARWIVSPGVPIIGLRIDENYSQRRKAANRVWVVALNALGEVYYLTQPPQSPKSIKPVGSTKCAWYAGRSTPWHLLESSRRQPRLDGSSKHTARNEFASRSLSNIVRSDQNHIVPEIREIEKLLRQKPAHFCKTYHGWDMSRKLEVDFANDDGNDAGEGICVIGSTQDDPQSSSISRFVRKVVSCEGPSSHEVELQATNSPAKTSSLFGGDRIGTSPQTRKVLDEWTRTQIWFNGHPVGCVTASVLDSSPYAVMTNSEDPTVNGTDSGHITPTGQAASDIPGRRARLLAVGTNTGTVLLWNVRVVHADCGIEPVRIIQTESPEITAVALTALYLVSGGSDGAVQAWDPLASTPEPIRIIRSHSARHISRHTLDMNPALRSPIFSAVGAIHLDPDPTHLRGVASVGTFVRYWSYTSSGQSPGKKRKRVRHSDWHEHGNSRRNGGEVKGHIVAETEELKRERRIEQRERARLRLRFGVGLGDLTEEEAVRYAEMISQESFTQNEQARNSNSDMDSSADLDGTSTQSTVETETPDPSVASLNPPGANYSHAAHVATEESDYELQIQQAIRLSLLEGQSPPDNSLGDLAGSNMFLDHKDKQATSGWLSSSRTPFISQGSELALDSSPRSTFDEDMDLALRLSLGVEDPQHRNLTSSEKNLREDDFPTLGSPGSSSNTKGKGKRTDGPWGR